MFQEFVQILDDMGRSIHAYQRCAARGYEKAGADPDHAAAYLLIALVAENFVTRNERMPLPADVAQAAYDQFARHVSRLEDAYKAETADAQVAALNRIAVRIAEER